MRPVDGDRGPLLQSSDAWSNRQRAAGPRVKRLELRSMRMLWRWCEPRDRLETAGRGLLLLAVVALLGCGGSTDAPPPGLTVIPPSSGSAEPLPLGQGYLLGPEDELQVVVLGHPELGVTAPVRVDGTITLPGAGTLAAAGKTPEELTRLVETRLAQILRDPRVDVIVTEPRPRGVYVVGEVEEPGERSYRAEMTVWQALGAAGGVLASGRLSSVLLMRRVAPDEIVVRRLDLEGVLDGNPGSVDPYVLPNDIVFVPKTDVAKWGQFVDQYIRPALSPVALYVQSWWALNLTNSSVRVSLQ
ncbi:MAG: hypothetical protein GF355_03425 [Candidatus Eisenbacteria bacterium]|nr:hypothetical protein [Candidatus Eisenbacteria bacterium]